MGLTGIFNDDKAVPFSKIQNGVHIRHLPVKVHRHDRRHPTFCFLVDQDAGLTMKVTAILKVLLELSRIQVVGCLVDIHKHGTGTSLRDRLCRCDESIRDGYNDIARSYTGREEREP